MARLLLVDGENLGLRPETVHRLVAAIARLGLDIEVDDVIVFFGRAARVEEYAEGLGWDARHLTSGWAGKNAADIALTVEAVDRYHHPDRRPAGVVIGGGDFDYRPLVGYLRQRGILTRLVVLPDAGINPQLEAAVEGVERLADDSPHAVVLDAGTETASRRRVFAKLLARLVPPPETRRDLLTGVHQKLTTNGTSVRLDDLPGYPDAARCLFDGSMQGRLGSLVLVHEGVPAGLGAHRGPWLDEAELGWLAWAGARLLGHSRDRIHTSAVKAALADRAGSAPHLAANAWALAQYLARPPWFVTAGLLEGHAAPPSYLARRAAVTARVSASVLTAEEAAALEAARLSLDPSTPPGDVDVEWIATVLRHCATPPKRRPVGWTFYFDAPFAFRNASLDALADQGLVI